MGLEAGGRGVGGRWVVGGGSSGGHGQRDRQGEQKGRLPGSGQARTHSAHTRRHGADTPHGQLTVGYNGSGARRLDKTTSTRHRGVGTATGASLNIQKRGKRRGRLLAHKSVRRRNGARVSGSASLPLLLLLVASAASRWPKAAPTLRRSQGQAHVRPETRPTIN